jgi:RNA polymerase sigma-70 factor (ECF subfamily)
MEPQINSQLDAVRMARGTGFGVPTMPITTSTAGLPVDTSCNSVPRCDQLLVCAAQAGCRKSFDELLNLYSGRVHRTLLAITKNAEDAEDAMQDAFLRAFLAIGRFEGRSSFYSWLTRIAINSALMILRRHRARPEFSLNVAPERDGEIVSMDFADSGPNPEEICYQQQKRAALASAIHKLKPDLREVVQARVMEECSVREVAERFNISEAAAKSRLLRARARLGKLRPGSYGSRSLAGSSRSSIAF